MLWTEPFLVNALDTNVLDGFRVFLGSETEENPLSDQQFVLLISVAFVAGGLYFLYDARHRFLRARQYASMRAFDPHSASQDGPVAVEGTVVAPGDTVSAPLSGTNAVAYRYAEEELVHERKLKSRMQREEMRQTGRTGSKTEATQTWSAVESEVEQRPFHVETESGPVAVEPEGARMELTVRTVDQPRFPVRLAAKVPILRSFVGLQREVESVLEPGEYAFVTGTVERPVSTGGETVGVVTGEDESKPFLVSTRSRRNLAFRNVLRGLLDAIPAFVLFAAAVVTVLVASHFGVFG